MLIVAYKFTQHCYIKNIIYKNYNAKYQNVFINIDIDIQYKKYFVKISVCNNNLFSRFL